jgi:hypothetical protein
MLAGLYQQFVFGEHSLSSFYTGLQVSEERKKHPSLETCDPQWNQYLMAMSHIVPGSLQGLFTITKIPILSNA